MKRPLSPPGHPPDNPQIRLMSRNYVERTTAPNDKPQDRNLKSKTSLCAHWTKGSCTNFDQCTFAHGAKELTRKLKTDGTTTGPPNCLNILREGTCPQGDFCSFSHNPDRVQLEYSSCGITNMFNTAVQTEMYRNLFPDSKWKPKGSSSSSSWQPPAQRNSSKRPLEAPQFHTLWDSIEWQDMQQRRTRTRRLPGQPSQAPKKATYTSQIK